MNINKILQLQLIYCFLAICYNLVSFFLKIHGGETLTPTSPLLGTVAMIIYASFLLAGYYKKMKLYIALMICSIIVFVYSGIIKHIVNYYEDPDLYASLLSAINAVLINSFGLVINSIAVFKSKIN